MTEHNINEAALAALGKLGKVASLANLVKSGGEKSKEETDRSIGKTSGRVNVKPIQGQKEELEVVCDFLIDRGFVTTGVEAENIYEHMSDEWKEYILNC